MKSASLAAITVLTAVIILGSGCASMQQDAAARAMIQIQQATGLAKVDVPDTQKEYLGKTHRGYKILFNGEAGNVWGRHAARMAIGEIGREVGGIMSFVTSSYKQGGDAAGSMLDRLLAKSIGQPLSITMILTHGKENAPRLDVLSKFSTIKPEDGQTGRIRLGLVSGSIYADDMNIARAVARNGHLMARLKRLRSQYIRLDGDAVTFMWAGQEKDFSMMINNHGTYADMLNALMEDLADIADAIPGPRPEKGR